MKVFMKNKIIAILFSLLLVCFSFGLVACDDDPKSCLVTFDSNGGSSVSIQYVLEGKTIDKPSDPAYRGYKFNGWYLNGKLWDFETNTVTEDIVLKAEWEEIVTQGLSFTTLSANTCSVSIGDAIYDDVIVIPEEHEGKQVVEIAENGFSAGRILSLVIFPETLTKINDGAFNGCEELNDVEIPASVTYIGADAFNSCYEMRNFRLKLGSRLETVGDRAFYSCRKMNSLVLPSTVTSIGEDAFYNCLALSKVNYLGTLDAWIDMGFATEFSTPTRYAKNLYINSKVVTSVDFGVRTEVPKFAFINCENLSVINISSSVTVIGKQAFSGCKGLKKINFEDGVTLGTIKEKAFAKCTGLQSVFIPESVSVIEKSAFEDCLSLNGVEFAKDSAVQEIKENTFKGCVRLKYIVLPTSVKKLCMCSFDNCKSLTDIYYLGTETEWNSVTMENVGTFVGALEEGQEEPPIVSVKDNLVKYLYSEIEPEKDIESGEYIGNFWKRDEEGKPIVWGKEEIEEE